MSLPMRKVAVTLSGPRRKHLFERLARYERLRQIQSLVALARVVQRAEPEPAEFTQYLRLVLEPHPRGRMDERGIDCLEDNLSAGGDVDREERLDPVSALKQTLHVISTGEQGASG